MVIKNAKKMKCLSVSFDYAQICKPTLEKLPKDLNKIYQLLARILYNSYSREFIKILSQ